MNQISAIADTPQIGPGLQRERKSRKLTLEQLAKRSGVSKSMLSQIERGQANPTFAVLWSLTQALSIEISDLVGTKSDGPAGSAIEILTVAHTPEMRNPDGLCRLRILSPPRLAGQSEWYEVEIATGGSLQSTPHTPGTFEHFTALTGGLVVQSGGMTRSLQQGETARYAADVPHAISNVGPTTARGFLVMLYT